MSQVPVTLTTTEFLRRWCLHIQPSQLTKTRYFGGWSNPQREAYLERCALQMDAAGVPVSEDAMKFPPNPFAPNPFAPNPVDAEGHVLPGLSYGGGSTPKCQHCDSTRLVLIETAIKPSWKDLLSGQSGSCPAWLAAPQEESDRRFWDAKMGAGYYDWSGEELKHVQESANDPSSIPRVSSATSEPRQLDLPGLDMEMDTFPALSF